MAIVDPPPVLLAPSGSTQAIMGSFPSILNPMPPVGIGHGAAAGQLYGSYAISNEDIVAIGNGDRSLGLERIRDFVDGSRVTPTFPSPPVDIAALIWANRDEKVE